MPWQLGRLVLEKHFVIDCMRRTKCFLYLISWNVFLCRNNDDVRITRVCLLLEAESKAKMIIDKAVAVVQDFSREAIKFLKCRFGLAVMALKLVLIPLFYAQVSRFDGLWGYH